ncbi:hypothetical protein C9374_008263 [Naegleria lovaniensis]|uniref:C2H2-type domain-containing protein n=1 Tax=Naegleria lovaniensis TaxID=51637 RepID=A0AA88GFV8_NAELO|nr:uncharacterized protein C9374_008263 [Naegleria lovaniensis]KAG2378624.1 hypothetical protein C9374_008263 [Naegleria lovaniensis]
MLSHQDGPFHPDVLSTIFSYLKHETVYVQMSLVCQEWYQVIETGNFIGEEFNLYYDKIFECSCTNLDEILMKMKRNSSSKDDDLVKFALDINQFYSTPYFDPYYPEYDGGEYRLIWRLASLVSNRFIKYLTFLQHKHGAIQSVKTINMYEILLLSNVLQIGRLTHSLFPSVTIVRCAVMCQYDKLEGFLSDIAKGFDKLQHVYLISVHGGSDDEGDNDSILPTNRSVNQSIITNVATKYPHIQFQHLEFSKIVSHDRVVEWQATTNSFQNSNEYQPIEIFTSDIELLSFLKDEPWIMSFHAANENILTMAIRFKFRESIKFILSQNLALLTRSTYPLLNYRVYEMQSPLAAVLTYTSPEDGIMDDIIVALQSLSKKSAEYIHDTVIKLLPAHNKRSPRVEPYSTLFSNFIPNHTPQVMKYVYETYGFDHSLFNLLKYQTGYSFTHYILQYFPSWWPYMKTFEPEQVFQNFEEHSYSLLKSNPLHALCNAHCSITTFQEIMKSYYDNHLEVLEQHLQGTTITKQTPLHTLLFLNLLGFSIKETTEKFWTLWEKCSTNLRKLLLMQNANGETPLEVFISCTRSWHIQESEDFIQQLVSQMVLENEWDALQVFRKLCLQRKSFSLLYVITRALEGRQLFPLKPDEEDGYDFLFWVAHPLSSTSIKHQFYYVLKSGFVNFKCQCPKTNRTLLHVVMQSRNREILVPFLIHFGVQVNGVDFSGNTCLHLIVGQQRSYYYNPEYSITQLLRNFGADVNLCNYRGILLCTHLQPRGTKWSSSKVRPAFICDHCLRHFTSQKALQSHEQAKHAVPKD